MGAFSEAGYCRTLEFRPEKAFEGRRLINHVIRVVDVTMEEFCETMCFLEPDCVSINLDRRADVYGKYKCELNNVTHEGHEHEWRENPNHFYHAAESSCVNNSCINIATCQSGFTVRGHRCVCPAGLKGYNCDEDIDECTESLHNCSSYAFCNNTEGSYNCTCKPGYTGNGRECRFDGTTTCKEAQERKIADFSGVVTLLIDSRQVPVFCYVGDFGCGEGGWTPVMKIDGSKGTFHYSSSYWTDRNEYNPPGRETGFDEQETKLAIYWNASFSKICLGMKINEQLRFIVINEQADSLYSLIADGQYRETSLRRDTWKTLIGAAASLQNKCNKEGFNAFCTLASSSKARIGIVSNQEDECLTCDSRIGFGTGGYPDDSNVCGNVAKHHPDNGVKYIKAMGYILVQ
nr:uncharacterized protein LOC131778575 [Pocillopora verrucosa]